MTASRRTLQAALVLACLAPMVFGGSVVRGKVILKQLDAVPGTEFPVADVYSPFTDGNGKVAFVARLGNSERIIWKDTAPIFFASDAGYNVLAQGDGTMGSSDAGDFIYRPNYYGLGAAYTNYGKLIAVDDAAPGLPGNYITRMYEPQMTPGGAAYWISYYADQPGGSTDGMVFYCASDISDPATIAPVLKSGDMVAGYPINKLGIGLRYQISDSSAHHIQWLMLDTGSADNNEVVWADGNIVAQEGAPTGDGDNWDTFHDIGINDAGTSVFMGFTDGPSASNGFIACNGAIALRKGDVVNGHTLVTYPIAVSINDRDDVVFIWDNILFIGNASNLANSIAVLAPRDELTVDGDSVGDWVIRGFNASSTDSTPDLDFAEDGFVYANVKVEPIGGGLITDAVVRIVIPTRPDSVILNPNPQRLQRIPMGPSESSANAP